MKNNTHKIAEVMACLSGKVVNNTITLKDEYIKSIETARR